MADDTALQGRSRADRARLLGVLLRGKTQAARARYVAPVEAAFLRDASLDPAVRPCGTPQHIRVESSILLTGGTGFLGAHLLHDLCRLTTGKIYCLVRADGSGQAMERLERNLARYTDSGLPAGRIVPVVGDLAKPGLGIAAEIFTMLASEVDAIIHNGAMLNHLARYDSLRAANVTSTTDLLRMAGSGKPKWLYYVSSMIAATDRDGEGALLEQFPVGDTSEITGGYAQSKWVSERLLAEAASRGFGVTVYRSGIIGGRRDTGAWAVAHDHLLLLIKSCLQMGYAAESPLVVDLTPVDFVSEAIVRISLAGPAHPVVHLSNPAPVPWTTLIGWLNEFGNSVQLVSFDVWQKRHLARSGESNALFPLLSVYLEESLIGKRELLIAKLARVSRTFTEPMLAGVNLEYPAVEKELWRKYVRYCIETGFFPATQKEPVA